jgi:hypothetical protein
MRLQNFDGGIGGGGAGARRSWRPFFVPEGVGGLCWDLISLQGVRTDLTGIIWRRYSDKKAGQEWDK